MRDERILHESLLPFYVKELDAIRRSAAQFATDHPKIADRLRLDSAGLSVDPHVERLLEGVAFLNARLRHRINDDFPDLTESLLGVLYPQFIRPVPSFSIAQFELQNAELTAGYHVERGANLQTPLIRGETCEFQTSYSMDLWPISVAAAELIGRPFTAPQTTVSHDAEAILRLTLTTNSPQVTFDQLKISRLRFYLHQARPELYELILSNTLGLAVDWQGAKAINDTPSPLSVNPVGFAENEQLLPLCPRTFRGYSLLQEYFCFPEKFQFFEIAGLESLLARNNTNQLQIILYLDCSNPEIEPSVNRENFRLGCTPIVNLFPQKAEPVQLKHRQVEYPVFPDLRRGKSVNLFSIDHIAAITPAHDFVEYYPFFSFKDSHAGEVSRFWHASRREASARNERDLEGNDCVYLTFVDTKFDPASIENVNWVMDIDTTCYNGDLPSQLPTSGPQVQFQLSVDGRLISAKALVHPTKVIPATSRAESFWSLISHLSLNHLSLLDPSQGPNALKEILRLYDRKRDSVSAAMIESVQKISYERVVRRIAGSPTGVAKGLQVQIGLNSRAFTGSSMYLFASVLNSFFEMYASLNSFSQLVVYDVNRPDREVLWTWDPRVGTNSLL